MVQKIVIYGSRVTEDAPEYLLGFLQNVTSLSIEFLVEEEFNKKLQSFPSLAPFLGKTFSSYHDIKEFQPELFFTFGGDGTILSAISYVKELEIPIVGINTGRLGFLATIHKKQFQLTSKELLEKKFVTSKRSVIEVKNIPEIEFPYALNDVSVIRKETTSMITIDANINDEFLASFWADGLIVSTPTGSTAYSLSCGGPIITPGNTNFVLTPVAPHNLNVRPILLESNCELRLHVQSRVSHYSLTLDSRMYSIHTDREITITKANFSITLAFLEQFSFYETLREKLLWGNDFRNISK